MENLSPEIQSELFIKYCSSFYGALLQNFKSIEKLCVVWRKALRQIWKLPYRTRCDIVACLTDMPCARHMFMQRMLKFANSALNYKVPVIAYVMQNAMSIDSSLLKSNVEYCCKALGTSYDESNNSNAKSHCMKTCKTLNAQCMTYTLKELLLTRDKEMHCMLTIDEVNHISNFCKLNYIFFKSCVNKFNIVKKFPIFCVPLGTK